MSRYVREDGGRECRLGELVGRVGWKSSTWLVTA